MSLEKLKKLKSVLDAQRQEKAKVEGQLEAAFDSLKKLGYANLKEAEDAVKTLDAELDKLDDEITTVTAQLEEKYAALL